MKNFNWYQENNERIKELNKRWIEENRDKKNWHSRKREAERNNAIGSHTFNDWQQLKKEVNYTCLRCGRKEPTIILTEDHIIPLSKNGTNYIDNIQPLCRSCNCKKHTEIIFYSPLIV